MARDPKGQTQTWLQSYKKIINWDEYFKGKNMGEVVFDAFFIITSDVAKVAKH